MKTLKKVTVVTSNSEESIKVEDGFVFDCKNDIYRVVMSGIVSRCIRGTNKNKPVLVVLDKSTAPLGDDVELVSKHLKVHGTGLSEKEAEELVVKLDNADPKDVILSSDEFSKAVAVLIANDEEFLEEVADIASEVMGGMTEQERTEFKDGVRESTNSHGEDCPEKSKQTIMSVLMTQFKK
tara:strand:+ start:79 stop:621 length:543 start_codon:yes stop_codon:yes gene_type:complete